MTSLKRLACALVLAALTSCAPVAVRTKPWAGGSIVAVPASWSFEGRLAVSNGKDSGSGRIRWEQDGEFFTISLRAPVSGQSWVLSGDRTHARLEGVRPYPVLGTSARELLQRELGWELPDRDVKVWLFGQGFGAEALLQRDAAGMLATAEDMGWHFAYREWHQQQSHLAPRRIVAKKSPYQVRLAIQRWQFGSAGADGAER